MDLFSETDGESELSRLISMSGTITAKRSLVDRVHDRVKQGLCLVCEEHGARRGLCTRHYQMWQRKQRSLPRNARAAFEVRLIRAGKLLGVNQVREIKADNPFELE